MNKFFKSVRTLTVSSVLVFGVVSANAQTLFTTSFSAAEGYSSGPLEGQSGNGSEVWVNGTEGNLTTRFAVENEQLVLTQNPDDNQWIYINFDPITGPFTATFEWQYIGAPESTVDFGFTLSDSVNFGLLGSPDVTFNECGVMIRMNVDPDLDVRNGDWEGGGTYSTDVPYNYQDGSHISIRLEVDTEGWIFDAFAQKEGEDEVQIADDYGFRRLPSEETNGLNSIAFWSNGDEPDNQVILDNIVLAGPNGPTPVSEWALY